MPRTKIDRVLDDLDELRDSLDELHEKVDSISGDDEEETPEAQETEEDE